MEFSYKFFLIWAIASISFFLILTWLKIWIKKVIRNELEQKLNERYKELALKELERK